MAPPYNIVITGGSKGVGRALAAEFLRAGDNVVICGRDGERPVRVLVLLCPAARCQLACLLPARGCDQIPIEIPSHLF